MVVPAADPAPGERDDAAAGELDRVVEVCAGAGAAVVTGGDDATQDGAGVPAAAAAPPQPVRANTESIATTTRLARTAGAYPLRKRRDVAVDPERAPRSAAAVKGDTGGLTTVTIVSR
jgi:hypothetical protein